MSADIDLQAILSELGPRFASGAAERDTDASFVADHYEALRTHKVFSAQVPKDLGGAGVAHGEMCAFIRGLARYSGETALPLSMHQHLVAAAAFNHRNGKPGQMLLEKVASDETILVSTGANDWLASSGTCERVDGGFLVSARKPFASGAPKGDVMVTSAAYDDPQEGWQVLHFPVPMASDGVSLAGDWQTMGMRGTGSETIVLEKVFVPDAAVVLRRPRAIYHPVFNVIVTVALPLIMSAYVGIGEAAIEIASRQAAKRSGDTATVFLLGELVNHLTTAQMAVDAMIAIAANGDFVPNVETANAMLVRKTIAAKAVLATVEKALETVGGAGYYRTLGLERLVRDAHAAQFHPLPEKRQQEFTGRLVLGLDPVGGQAEERLKSVA